MLLAVASLHAWHVWIAVAPTHRVSWQGGEGCPAPAEVLEQTATVLGRDLDEFASSVEVEARVEAQAGGGQQLELSLRVDGLREDHELWALDCERLGADVAFLIATALDPFVLWPASEGPSSAPAAPALRIQYPSSRPAAGESELAVAEPPRQPEPEPEPAPDAFDFGELEALEPGAGDDLDASGQLRARPGQLTATLGVGGTSFVGLFPNIGGGVQAEGGLERGLLRWQLGATGWFGGRFRSAAGLGADLLAVSGATGPCALPRAGRFSFALCAVAGGGAIRAAPVNTSSSTPRIRPWAFAGADVRVTWAPRPRVGVFLGVSVLPALVRPAWSVSNPEAVHVTPPVTGSLRLGVELRTIVADRR